jgi:hypothetical protein
LHTSEDRKTPDLQVFEVPPCHVLAVSSIEPTKKRRYRFSGPSTTTSVSRNNIESLLAQEMLTWRGCHRRQIYAAMSLCGAGRDPTRSLSSQTLMIGRARVWSASDRCCWPKLNRLVRLKFTVLDPMNRQWRPWLPTTLEPRRTRRVGSEVRLTEIVSGSLTRCTIVATQSPVSIG